MPKSLRLTLTHVEDLPSPLAIRMQVGERTRQVAIRKAFDVPFDSPLNLRFYSSGELLGQIRLRVHGDIDCEAKWLPVGQHEIDYDWSLLPATCSFGPRVKAVLEATKPLSPILETNETGEEREECMKLREMVRTEGDRARAANEKNAELTAALLKERTQAELREGKYKSEIAQLAAALEKAKNAQKHDSAVIDSLSKKLTDTDALLAASTAKCEQLQQVIKSREDAVLKKSREIAEIAVKVSMLESDKVTLESKLKLAESQCFHSQFDRLRSDFQDSASTSQTLTVALSGAKLATRNVADYSPTHSVNSDCKRESAFVSVVEAENAALALKVAELQKIIGKLRSELSNAVSEAERKERDVKKVSGLLETAKAKIVAQETTIKVLKAATPEKSKSADFQTLDVVDEMLRDYMERRKTPLHFLKLGDGRYRYGGKEVSVILDHGELQVRTRKDTVPISDFLRKRESKSVKRSIASASKISPEARAKSVDLSLTRVQHRSVSIILDRSQKVGSSVDLSPSFRLDTESSVGGHKPLGRLFKRRGSSPKRDYLKGTISSSNKVTEKSRNERQKSRVMKK